MKSEEERRLNFCDVKNILQGVFSRPKLGARFGLNNSWRVFVNPFHPTGPFMATQLINLIS